MNSYSEPKSDLENLESKPMVVDDDPKNAFSIENLLIANALDELVHDANLIKMQR